MRKVYRLFAASLAILLIALAPFSNAQSDKGALSGKVTDTSGSVLQGASVELQPTGAIVATNQQGAYSLKNLAPGTYTITVDYLGI